MKSFLYKIYSRDGANLLATLARDVVISTPSFTSQIGGGFGNCSLSLALPFYDYDRDVFKNKNIVRIYESDSENPNGRLIYSGFISIVDPFVENNRQGVKVEILGLASLLMENYFVDGSDFNFTVSATDPAQIMRDIIDQYNTANPGSIFSYDGTSVVDVGATTSPEYKGRKLLEALQDTFEFAGGGYYWFIDQHGKLFMRPKPATSAHTFTVGKDIVRFNVKRSVERVINQCMVKYASGTYTASDGASIALFGVRALYVEKTDITDAGTAQKFAEQKVADNKDEKIEASIKINSNYDIESVQVGDSCKVRNIRSTSEDFTDNMLIAQISYNPESIDIRLEAVSSFSAELLRTIN